MHSDAGAFTGVYFVTHDAAGHHFEFVRAGSAASRMTPADLAPSRIASARVLHLSGISLALSATARAACRAAIAAAGAAGVRVSFDTNLRLQLWPLEQARAAIGEAMASCDICLPGLDGHGGADRPDRSRRHRRPLPAAGRRHRRPRKARRGGRRRRRRAAALRIAPHPCRAVDATVAGDTFGGAFVARLLAGDDIDAAGRYAAVAAALSTEGYGAVEPIPTAAQVRAVLAGGA